jgi:hypothetical protein
MLALGVAMMRKRLAYRVAKVCKRVAYRVALLRALNLPDVLTMRIGCLEGCEKRARIVWIYPKSA